MSEPVFVSGKKRLALFLDGTWNEHGDNTNIWRLRSLVASLSADAGCERCEQRAYYSTGLGTKVGEKVRGGMFGTGINAAIRDAYDWLIANYDLGDEVFIFGFSRGAYTARSLAGFIAKCGLLQRGAPLGIGQLYSRYRRQGATTLMALQASQNETSVHRSFEERWMLEYCHSIKIAFIGIFDTVGALGVPFPLYRKLKGEAYPFLNTGLRLNYENAFHALAVDEHRYAFRPTLWTNQGAQNALPRDIGRTEQRWFIGAHANVGGGCESDPLAQIPLNWLVRKATALGLSFDKEFIIEPRAFTYAISNSFAEFAKGLYRVSRLGIPYYRGIGVPPANEGPDVKTINETIDLSVFDRWRADASYRPPALKAWADKWKIDLSILKTSVRTDNPAIVVAD